MEATTPPKWHSEFVDAIERGDAEYVRCAVCDAAELPPRTTCAECGSTDVEPRDLPDGGEILTFTEITTTFQKFEDEVPYTVAVAELADDLRVTGQVRGAESVGIGDEVTVGVERRDEREDIIVLRAD
jgi:uncharacterized OB-fold protein